VLAVGLAAPVGAQEWPNRPIKLIVSFGAGGGSDIVSRIIAHRLQERLGQAIVVENRPGAGGLIGNEVVAKAVPDGYTIANMSAGQIIAAVLKKEPKFDTLKAFEPIGQVATTTFLIAVRPDYAAKSVKELVALAKADPDKIIFGSPGFGATQHLAAELFMQTAGVKMRHVPFKNSPTAIAAVMGKQIDVVFDTVTALSGQIGSGEIKAIAVTSATPFPTVPSLPPAAEALPGYEVTSWYGFFGPKGMPKPIVDKLNQHFNEIIREPAVAERLTKVGVIVKGSTPDAFGKLLADEYAKWDGVREKAGFAKK
jgi:tripartite-type tricarboxylate transporter receptor subunit TctC